MELHAQRCCENVGGYPSVFDELPGHVIEASEGHRGPELNIYRNCDVVKAYRESVRCVADGDFDNLEDAFMECWPLTKWRAIEAEEAAKQ